MKALCNLKLIIFTLLFSGTSEAVLIDYQSVLKVVDSSCEKNTIDFKKDLWKSNLAEKKAYGQIVGIKNECLSGSDKVYVEIYYQYKDESILLDNNTESTFKAIIENDLVEEDLLNLVSWLFEKIQNFNSSDLGDLWQDKYGEKMRAVKRLMIPSFPDKSEVQAIYHQDNVASENYKNGLSLYMFCRRNRNYQCLLTGKNKNKRPILRENGELWSHPALAMSSRGLPSNVVNGQTPQGVHTIDSVMPEANRQIAFGKYRRLILNWVRGSFNDREELNFLPQDSIDTTWWRQASLSKKVGRKDLRIHGTGKINDDPTSTHFPFRKSAGCITQREGRYGDINYLDQRLLLDTLMEAMNLEVDYENEELIKGVLYVIEINDDESHVQLSEVEELLNE